MFDTSGKVETSANRLGPSTKPSSGVTIVIQEVIFLFRLITGSNSALIFVYKFVIKSPCLTPNKEDQTRAFKKKTVPPCIPKGIAFGLLFKCSANAPHSFCYHGLTRIRFVGSSEVIRLFNFRSVYLPPTLLSLKKLLSLSTLLLTFK